MPGSTPVGGHTTPLVSASRSLGLSDGVELDGGDGRLELSGGHGCVVVGACSALAAPVIVVAASPSQNAAVYALVRSKRRVLVSGSGISRTRPDDLTLPSMAETKIHKVVRTQVIETTPTSREFAVIFTFDDGSEDFGIVGHKAKAEYHAKAQMGKVLPIGVLPIGVERRKLQRKS